MKELKVHPKLPGITILVTGLFSVFLSVRSICNYLFLVIGQFYNSVPSFVLFGNSLSPGLIGFLTSTVFLILSWLISTKYEKTQRKFWRNIWFWNMFIGITAYYMWLITAPVYNTLIPYLGNLINSIHVDNIWFTVAVGDINTLFYTLVFTPSIVTSIILIWLGGQYSQYSKQIKEAFEKFEFKNVYLQKWFRNSKEEVWPDVVLGPDSQTKELIVQPGKDRSLHNGIFGPPGTGKTSALILPIINQDLHWLTKFINAFPKVSKLANYKTEEIRGTYLSSISIIEPSNDLCQKAFQLVKAHDIPEEAVFYIDPTNPNTPSINPMQGPVDQVAEAFAMVMDGIQEGGTGNFFFQQSQRNHLKNYIYLLKLHDPSTEAQFDTLLKMYNDPQIVRHMHLKLKETIPKDYHLIKDRDERNHWDIVKQIDNWFNMNHIPKTSRNGANEQVKEGEYYGETAYFDAQGEYVQGLRNVLNDIGANKLIRRVLFDKSEFSFDEHLNRGGILLVNTAKDDLGGLSNVLGKFVLLSLQNAVYRRTPLTSTFAHIIIDEFPDYIYLPFKEFISQARKYKAIITVAAQTVAQLADKYGEMYMHTLLTGFRHKMVYGDISYFDAQLFSKLLGEEDSYEEGKNEQTVSPLQEEPVMRSGSSYQQKTDVILTPNKLIFQEPFQAAVKIVVNNKPIPVRQIDANFVPKAEFKEAKVKVIQESASIWLESKSLNTELFHETDKALSEIIDIPLQEEEPLIGIPLPEKDAVEDIELELVEFDRYPDKYLSKKEIKEEAYKTKPISQKRTSLGEKAININDEVVDLDVSRLFSKNIPPSNELANQSVSELDEKEESFYNDLIKEIDDTTKEGKVEKKEEGKSSPFDFITPFSDKS